MALNKVTKSSSSSKRRVDCMKLFLRRIQPFYFIELHGNSPNTRRPRLMMSAGHDLCQENLRLLKAEFKLVTDERDQYKGELDHYKRRAIQQQNSGSIGSMGSMDETGAHRRKRDNHSNRDYDRLKNECQKAKKDLESLNNRYMELSRKCKNYATACEKQTKELRSFEQECFDLKTEKRRAQQEIIDLKQLHEDDKRELNSLREMINQRGSSEVLNKMYDTALEKYEGMKKSYDELRRRYLDKDEELMRMRSKFEAKQQEHEQLIKDSTEARQRFHSMILSRDEVIRDRSREIEEFKKGQRKAELSRSDLMKDIENAKTVMMQAEKDLARVMNERDDAIQEYSRVMSERDVVHKEIDALQDEAQAEKRKRQQYEEEKAAAIRERDMLKEQLRMVMKDRDEVFKQVRDMDKKFAEISTDKVEVLKERDEAMKDFEKFRYERDIARKERTEAMEERDKILRECYDVKQLQQYASSNFEHAHKKIESLKKDVERLQDELKEANQEAEVAKQRRDWAFSERDKIVLERESIRTLCDKLRRDRDRAVSQLAEAMRDSDDINRQKNVATKELKDVREKLQVQEEKESRMKQLIAHQSRDSAIDADSGEWETETVELETEKDNVNNLGFEIGNAKEYPQSPDDCSICITKVNKGSIADGRLKVNDCLLKINDVDLTNVDPMQAIQAVKSGGGVLNMVIKRRRPSSGRALQPIRLSIQQGRDHGLTLEQGIFISRVTTGSVAAKEGNLAVGDRIINVNGSPVENKSAAEVEKLLLHAGDSVSLSVLRSPTSSTASGNSMLDSLKEKDSQSSRSSLARSPSHGEGMEDLRLQLQNANSVKHSFVQTEDIYNVQMNAANVEKVYPICIQHLAQEKPVGAELAAPKPVKPVVKESPKYRDPPSFVPPPPPPLESPDEDSKLASLPRIHGRKHLRNRGSGRGWPKQESGGTWPKSQGPPDMYELEGQGVYIVHRRPKPRPTILSTGYEWRYAQQPKDNSNGEVPPVPPDRDSSLKASFRHSRQSSTHSSDSASTIVADNMTPHHTPTPSSTSTVTMTPSHTPQSSKVSNGPSSQNGSARNSREENENMRLATVHYQTNSTPETAVDYTVVSGTDINAAPVVGRPTSAPPRRMQEEVRPHSITGAVVHQKPAPMETATVCVARNSNLPPLVSSADVMPIPVFRAEAKISPSSSYVNGTQIRTSPHSHPSPHSAPATTTVLRFKEVPFFTAQSRVVSHANQPAIATQPPMPRYSTHSPSQSVSNNRDSERAGSDSPNSILSEEFSSGSPGSSRRDINRSLDYYSSPSHSPQKRHTYNSFDINDQYNPLPANRTHRIKFPANPNRRSPGGHSSSSFDKSSSLSMSFSDRSSPISPPIPENGSIQSSTSSLSVSQGSNSMPRQLRPRSDQPRYITIDKTSEPSLGFSIKQGPQSGVFVASVNEGSLAAAHGLDYGDQILEFNGINLRCATYNQAANILRQGGESVTILVQYNPKKLEDDNTVSGSSSSAQSTPTATPISTATNSPTTSQSQMDFSESGTMTPPSPRNGSNMSPMNNPPGSMNMPMTLDPQRFRFMRHTLPTTGITEEDSLDMLTMGGVLTPSEPRFVFLEKPASSSLGIRIVGGNAVGIFVSEIQSDSVANSPDGRGLKQGDQILEFNGVDLRSATAEQATIELQKPTETVSILAQTNISKFKQIRDKPGDRFFIKTLTDRLPETEGDLNIKKDEVYFVDDTMFKDTMGLWRAWKIDTPGNKPEQICGQIPSRAALEQEIIRKRSFSEGLAEDELRNASSRRGSASARRSFFRRKKHQRNNSKDSRELSSMDGSISTSCDSVPIHEDFIVPTYQRVERLDSKFKRPVLLLGTFVDAVTNKMVLESPNKFCRCVPEIVRASPQSIEKSILDCLIIDKKRRRSHYEIITVAAIKEVSNKNCHCILDVCPTAVERLHRVHLFPIVIFLKHKSAKQIKEQKDPRFLTEKITMKQAKEMFDIATRMETEFKHLFTAIVQGPNLARLCMQVKKVVDQEQGKTLWVPSSNTI
ncbi:disks large homolog 5-like isoform X2 [Ptychodera flava]|uniref:disks large homolog 5-like isoform X2 n=1 Tax=Ptychodera flava TaxID=63121 RepID=UPI00396A596A